MTLPQSSRPLSLFLGVALLFGAEAAGAQIRTVLVSPVPGNPVASGSALHTALAGIASPSATNRYLLKIEPGIFDVGTVPLAMRSWVDIEGSGMGMTTIRGSAFPATLNGASDAELRFLTVEAKPNTDGAMAMENSNASPRIYRVRFSVTGGTYGVRNVNSTPLIEECEITVTALGTGLAAYGVSFRGFPPAGRSSIVRSKIAVSGAQNNHGVSMRDSQSLREIRDSRIDVFGGQTTRGVYAFAELSWSGQEILAIRNTEISSAAGSVASYGVHVQAPAWVYLDITGGKTWGYSAPTSYGVKQDGAGPAVFQGASVLGPTQTVQSASAVTIANTGLQGGPATSGAWIGCIGVWDENNTFYAQTCP
jgi:hypothetical protein